MKKCEHDFVWIEETAATEGYSQCKKCAIIKGSKEYWYEQFQAEQGAEGQLETAVMPNWILVKDRLPKREGQYLVCDTSGSILSAYFEGTKFTKGEAGGFWVVAVVGWLPLPKPLRA